MAHPSPASGFLKPAVSWFIALATLFRLSQGATAAVADSGSLRPTELPGLRYTNAFFPGVTYRTNVPSLDELLGFPAAERAADSAAIERCLKAWSAAAPDRTRLVEYARTYEGRPLHYLVVTSPTNLARLDDIQSDLARLADPRRVIESEADRMIQRLPAVAWLAYTIHGDETEGSDAALVVIHHLLAAEDVAVSKLLDDLVIIIDPLMNPDGRDRFLKMVAEHRGTAPDVDDQSLLHTGYWPHGRGNHYLFDLNRDWLFGVHPETRGRIREVGRWNPVLFVDAHGMGSQDTHLFSPAREPINPNIPTRRRTWQQTFSSEQARAFDARGLVYYTGEWFEEWFPGYSDSWASYRGAVGILYEQARIAEDGVRRPDGRILSYRESVLHHVVGSLANLETTRANARKLLADFHATRREALDRDGPYGRRTFAVVPTANASRLREFVELMKLQGFELYTAADEITGIPATDQLGRSRNDLKLPSGTLLLPNRQPLGHLLAAFLEFDPQLSTQALEDERREILRVGGSRIYDVTSWNLTMMYGLESYTLASDLPAGSRLLTAGDQAGGITATTTAPVAWIFDGADDNSLAAAARLMERGVNVRVADKPFAFDNHQFDRGSIVVTRLDNRVVAVDLAATVGETARELRLAARAVTSGLGPGDLPDLGGGHFQRLEPPRIATVRRGGAYGSIWYTLDHRLGIRHSQLDSASGADLARYNVLILPERGSTEDAGEISSLKDWVQRGGTLICVGGAARPFMTEAAGFSRVRDLPDVLGRLPEFELAVLREWQGRVGSLPPATNLWSHELPAKVDYPWQITEGAHLDEKELKRRDAWQALFMPDGAILATRIDTNHWLTAGCPEPLPVLSDRGPILMAAEGVDAPIRFGYLTENPTNAPPAREADREKSPSGDDAKKSEGAARKEAKESPPRPGWAALPTGTAMHLRMSGLVWPEATHRLAHAAWVTRESLGRGQVILFATPPTFRAGALGTTRVFLNAVVLGPGLGTRPSLRP